MVSRLDWRSSDVHGQRQEKEEDAGDEGADRTVNTTVKQGQPVLVSHLWLLLHLTAGDGAEFFLIYGSPCAQCFAKQENVILRQ